MLNYTLEAFYAPEIQFINKRSGGGRIRLETKYTYNVKFSNELTCRCELIAEASDKEEPERFRLKVVTVGVFSYKEGTDKDFLHVDTFKVMFPYLRALVTTVTANSGIPAIILPEADMEGQHIYRIEGI